MHPREFDDLLHDGVGAVRGDIDDHVDMLITGRRRVLDTEHTADIDLALDLGEQRLDGNAERGRAQHERRGDRAGQGVQQELECARALIMSEQRWRLGIREFERLIARDPRIAEPVEIEHRRAVFAPADPAVARAEAEPRQVRIRPDHVDDPGQPLKIDPVAGHTLTRHRVHPVPTHSYRAGTAN